MITELRGSQPQPQAFDVEYSPRVHRGRLSDEVMTYLGEYRFKLKEQQYTLLYDGKIRDLHEFSSLAEAGRKKILKNKRQGLPTHREESDLRGVLNLEDQLRFATSGDTIFWASPPGPSEEGYGNYGFVYWGRVVKDNLKTELQMVAVRVEDPTIAQFNSFMSVISGYNFNFDGADRFVASPIVVNRNYSEEEILKGLYEAFGFQKDASEKERLSEVKGMLKSRIEDFFDKVRFGTRHQKQKALYALENYSVLLWQGKTFALDAFKNFDHFVEILGHEPQKVLGSCGSSGGIRSNGLSIYTNGYDGISEDSEWFVCPNCHYKADGPIGNQCPGCGLTKEQFAKDGGEVC